MDNPMYHRFIRRFSASAPSHIRKKDTPLSLTILGSGVFFDFLFFFGERGLFNQSFQCWIELFSV